jgi:hypothetical protein
MYATKEKKLVWRGAVSNAVEIKLNLDRSEKKIEVRGEAAEELSAEGAHIWHCEPRNWLRSTPISKAVRIKIPTR